MNTIVVSGSEMEDLAARKWPGVVIGDMREREREGERERE